MVDAEPPGCPTFGSPPFWFPPFLVPALFGAPPLLVPPFLEPPPPHLTPSLPQVCHSQLLPRRRRRSAGLRHHQVSPPPPPPKIKPNPAPKSPFFPPNGSRETYNALTHWLTDARTLASPNIVIILCGNKKDLDGEREVTFLEASRFAQENGGGLGGLGGLRGLGRCLWGTCGGLLGFLWGGCGAQRDGEQEVAFLEASRFVQENSGGLQGLGGTYGALMGG